MCVGKSSTLLGSFVTLVFLCQVTGSVYGDVIHVPGDYPTIQAGIDAAFDGDIVEVADATYTGVGNKELDFGGRLITVRCPNGPDACIIDCESLGRGLYFHSGETANAVFEGFTITNGYAYEGGAVSCESSSPTFTNCVFHNNEAVNGGAMYITASEPTVRNCLFHDNIAVTGGGIWSFESSLLIIDCTFRDNANSAVSSRDGAVSITGCTFTGNGDSALSYTRGTASVIDCTFEQNTGSSGGAIRTAYADVIVVGSVFRRNSSSVGGAIFNDDFYYGYGEYAGSLEVYNCVFVGNTASSTGHRTGGAIHNCGVALAVNCVFTANSAGWTGNTVYTGYDWGSTLITGSILWGNGLEPVAFSSYASVSVTFSDVEGGWPGVGNIDTDPLFVDADGPDDVPGTEDDDLRLLAGSPCVNGGWGYVPNLPDTDLDGNARVQACRVDMGAYETPYPPVALPDCNGNDLDDACEIVDGISVDCNQNHAPDPCDITDGSSADCNANGVPDECDIAGPSDSDCNENGILDACDIALGTSLDDDEDSYPDECPYFSFVPIPPPPPSTATYGDGVVIRGNEIFLPPGEHRVWLEARLGHWGPRDLNVWQATLDPSGYSSGDGAPMGPALAPCSAHDDCLESIGSGVCDNRCPNGEPCGTSTGCGDGIPCEMRFCKPGFQDCDRVDVLFYRGVCDVLDRSSPRFRFGSVAIDEYGVDYGTPRYGFTFAFDVPGEAAGTYTIDIDKRMPHSYIGYADYAEGWVRPFAFTKPAKITVCSGESQVMCCLPRGECKVMAPECCELVGGRIPIPAVSVWGIAIMGLVLLTTARVYFSKRHLDRATR